MKKLLLLSFLTCFLQLNAQVPADPSDANSTAVSDSAIDITWTDNSGDETGFKIERKNGTGVYSLITTTAADVVSFSDTGLSSLTVYTYRVTATNGSGDSSASNESSAGTQSSMGNDALVLTPTGVVQNSGGDIGSGGFPATISGIGLSAAATISNVVSVTHIVGGWWPNSWLGADTASPNYFDDGDFADPQFELDLGASYNVSSLVVWGGEETQPGRAASRFSVEFSSDGGTSYGSPVDALATESSLGTSVIIPFQGGIQTANYLRLTITENGGKSGFSEKHQIKKECQFTTWERVFEQPKFADAVIITTPDQLHYGPCMKALELGYDVLLEKPISPSEQECRNILALAKKTGRVVGVCHVLRYAPYFEQLKHIIDNRLIGDLISVQHLEPIGYEHMAHSYVRGNWHNSKESTPIILGKSCHDLDILRWLVGAPCDKIVAFGDQKWFLKKNAPQGSTARCMDGCTMETECPYSALKLYYRNRHWTYVFDFPEDTTKHDEFILQQLETTNYGRCVYHMDNDQPDHYVSSMQFNNGVTANFSMEAFTSGHGRKTRLMGSLGDIVGDMGKFVHTDFRTGKQSEWNVHKDLKDYHGHGHGGGDWRLVKNWLQAVSKNDPSLLTSTIDASIESHIMGFMAEKSRLNNIICEIKL